MGIIFLNSKMSTYFYYKLDCFHYKMGRILLQNAYFLQNGRLLQNGT